MKSLREMQRSSQSSHMSHRNALPGMIRYNKNCYKEDNDNEDGREETFRKALSDMDEHSVK